MKFSINKTELQNALTIVLKGVSSRPPLPALSGVFIEAHADGLTLQTTDLVSSVQYEVAALVEEEGKTVVPGKLFGDIVKNLADAAVRVQQREGEVHITCETSSFSVKTMNPDDFPAFPHVEADKSIEIPFSQFARMVHSVERAVSRDESRPILTGILITVEEGTLRMVATDSHRLALAQADIEGQSDFEAILPSTFLHDIVQLPKTEDPVKVSLAENQIMVTCDRTVFINSRIEGTYPNYKSLLPDSYNTRAEFDVAELTAGAKRASLLSSINSPLRVDFNIPSQTILIDSIAIDVGSAQETIPCKIEGEDMEIGFNSRYLIDGLSALNCDRAQFDLRTSSSAGILHLVDDDSFLYMIMPIDLKKRL